MMAEGTGEHNKDILGEETQDEDIQNVDIQNRDVPRGDDISSQNNAKSHYVYPVINLLIYAILPFIVITFIRSNYTDLDQARLNNVIMWTSIIGTTIAIISYFETYYPPGHKGRLVSGIISTGMMYIWIYGLFGGTTIRSTYGEYEFFIDISRMLALIIFGISLKLIYRIIEFITCRKTQAQ